MSAQAQQTVASPATTNGDLLPTLDQLFAETVALFHRLRAVAPLMLAHGDLEQDECTVLRTLNGDTARPVTEIANDSGLVKTQAQKAVKALEKRGLLEMTPNPENKRSKLARLTEDGRTIVLALDQREIELLSSLPIGPGTTELQAAAETLAAVRDALNDNGWRELLSG